MLHKAAKAQSRAYSSKENRQAKVLLSQIDKVLDVEFSEYQAKLDEQVVKMNAALERSHGKMMTDEETRELKRAIVQS